MSPGKAVASAGTITTVAGNGKFGYTGDGGLATAAEINEPVWVALTPDGGYLIAEYGGNRIRKVSASGIITTVAGNSTAGYKGDGGPATAAELNQPGAAVPNCDGGILIADSNNDVIRRVAGSGSCPKPQPIVKTGSAKNVTRTSATLNGTVNPRGSATTYYFQYGASTGYGKHTSSASAGSGTTTRSESASISGLRPGTRYHFRIVAKNASGTSYGADKTFTTRARPLNLAVSPNHTKAGSKTCFNFTATSSGHRRRRRSHPSGGPNGNDIAYRQGNDLRRANQRHSSSQRHQADLPHRPRSDHRHRRPNSTKTRIHGVALWFTRAGCQASAAACFVSRLAEFDRDELGSPEEQP